VVVVEATRPNTPEPSHEPWEPILLDAGYELVYRDGLNRFYLAGGHDDLRAAFDAPPNYWDHFVTAAQRVAERRSIAASERARAAESRVAALESKLAAMRASLSWRLTRPLRAIGRGLRSLRRSSRQG
jgi:hypothetical protein